MRFLAVATVATLALVVAGACASGPEVVYYHGDFPRYESVSELYDRANLVVRARITDGTEVRPIKIGSADDTTLVYTVYRAEVQRVFKGRSTGPVVEVKLMGGAHDGVKYIADGTIDLTPGQTYLLFLETYADAPASLLNPAQSQYVVGPSGLVTSVGDNRLRVSESDLERLSTRR